MSAVAQRQTVALPRVAPYRSTPWTAFGALMLRDLTVLRKNFVEFVLRTVMQPLLFVFVFTYVFPQIGQGVGGAQPARHGVGDPPRTCRRSVGDRCGDRGELSARGRPCAPGSDWSARHPLRGRHRRSRSASR